MQSWDSGEFSLALASTWLLALPFLSCLEGFCPSRLLLPRECCHHSPATGAAALLTITFKKKKKKKISLVKKVVNHYLKTNARFAIGFLSAATEMLFILMW